jgi:hypothetical protein
MDALKHLYFFTAFYIDGTQYDQGRDDISVRDPQRSAYYDIAPADGSEPFKDVPLLAFRLMAAPEYETDETVPRVVMVDLLTGAFQVDGKVFFHHAGDVRDFQPIYFRVVNQHRNMTIQTTDGEVLETKDTQEIAAYGIGWRGKDGKGNAVEEVLYIPIANQPAAN